VCRSLLKGKSKVKVVTVRAINAFRGTEVQRHPFLISALDAGVWSASRPGRFTLGERAFVSHSTHRVRGWVGPRAGQDFWRQRGLPLSRYSNPDRPNSILVTIMTELSRLPALVMLEWVLCSVLEAAPLYDEVIAIFTRYSTVLLVAISTDNPSVWCIHLYCNPIGTTRNHDFETAS